MTRRFPRTKKRAKLLEKISSSLVARSDNKKRNISVSLLSASVFAKPRAYIPSGILPIDLVVSGGKGFPAGIVEIFGPEHTLKTAILEYTLAESQRRGYFTGIWPVEFSLDYKRMKSVGVDPERLYVGEAETFEDIFEEIKVLVSEVRKKDTVAPIVLGWDTIAATSTRSEMDHKGGLEGGDMGKAGLMMSRFFRRLKKFLFVNKVGLICINQTRTNLGQMWGSKETTPGGKALKFYAWARCRTNVMKVLRDADGDREGMQIKFEVVKNKIAPPFQSCLLPIYWDRGIDVAEAVWLYAVEEGLFKRKGTAYRYNGHVMTRNVFVNKYYHTHKEQIDKELRRL